MRTRMEVAASLFGVAVAMLTIVATALALRNHAYVTLWVCCAAFVCAGLGGACWLHDHWAKQDAIQAAGLHTADRPWIVLDSPIMHPPNVGEPLHWGFYLKNTGTDPGIVQHWGNTV